MIIIKTNRLILRPIKRTDAPRFAALCNDIDIARNTARIPHPYTPDHAREFVDRSAAAFDDGTEYAFAVCRNDEIIACAGVMQMGGGAVEIGYWVGAAYRRAGIAVEAAQAVSQYAFEQQGNEKAVAGFFTDNPASGRVLTKIGFTATGEIAKTNSLGRGGKADTVRMVLHKEDFYSLDSVRFQFLS